MVTRTERAMVMGWRSSNIEQLLREENSGLSMEHWRWWDCVCVGGGGGGSWGDTPHDRAHGDLHVTYTLLLRLDHPNFISYGPSKLRTHTHSPADSN